MKRHHWIAIALAIVIGLGIALYPRPAEKVRRDASDPAFIAQGHALYEQHCAECHGKQLEGQANWRERRADGKLPAPPHDASGHTWHHPDRVLFRVTKEGMAWIAGANYQTDMPAFAGKLSDAQIEAVIAYIKSSWPAPVQAQQRQIDEEDRRRG